MTRTTNSRSKFLFRKAASVDETSQQRSEYVFAYEDAGKREEAKRALSFAAPGCLDSISEENKNDRYYSVDFGQAFQFDKENDDSKWDAENNGEAKYKTIFTYSELPMAGASLVDREELLGPQTKFSKSVLSYFICALSFLLFVVCSPILCWIFIKHLSNKERIIVFRLGRRLKPKGPGFVFLLPFCDQFHRIRLDDQTVEISPVSSGTKDEAIAEVRCSVNYRLTDPDQAYLTVRQSPAKLVSTNAQLCLASALKNWTWTDLSGGGAKMDLSSETMATLNFRCGAHGIQIGRIEILELNLIRPPPSPDTVKKQKMTTIGKQLRALSSAFLQRAPNSCGATSSQQQGDTLSDLEKLVGCGLNAAASMFTEEAIASATSKKAPSPLEKTDRKESVALSGHLPSNAKTSQTREAVLQKVVNRARPFLSNSLVCRALDRACLVLVVAESSDDLQSQLPGPVEASGMEDKYSILCLDAEEGDVSIGTLPKGRAPDVVLYLTASDLSDALAGRIDLVNAIRDGTVFVTGNTVMFNKLRHLIHM